MDASTTPFMAHFNHGVATIPTAMTGLGCLLVVYIIYQRYFHPLANYPGPFVASLTDFWKVFQMASMQMPYRLTELHELYGPVLRIGPSSLSFSDPEAIPAIYQSGRMMEKTAFYDSFTTFNPNVFGTRDEDFHALRRRQMSYGFSMASVKQMETHLDRNIAILCAKLDRYAEAGEAFCLKDCLAYYIVDVLGELAFSRSFDAQVADQPQNIPPVKDHLLLACTMGQIPSMLPILKKVCALLPFPWLQRLYESREKLRQLTASCVSARLQKPSSDRRDLLTSLIEAKDPETGSKLSELDINTEAFGFIIAGSHTTGGTLCLLFWHLLHNPSLMERCMGEVDEKLPHLSRGQDAFPVEGLEAKLVYIMACIKENFRINPVFTMPLTRRVLSKTGADIAGHRTPYGTTVSVINHCSHHNSAAWGPDHDVYDPSRWFDERAENMNKHLIPFSIGHRMCIGKTIAMTNILKVTSTLLRRYTLQAVDTEQKRPRLYSVGVTEMDGPMLCRVQKRELA